ncbi:MAG: NADH-quinone oxidoreductase subunit J [Thermodesulfobacteriota bacterium]
METVVFYVFAALSVAGALLVITHKNPVSSAVSLVLTLFSTAVLFVLLLAHFVAAIQILVYAGAIMVLFLFTVMFLNLRPEALSFDARNMAFKVSVFLVVILFTGYFASMGFNRAFSQSGAPAAPTEGFGTVEGVGRLLFTDYLLPFELTSVLIVAAIIGVVAIAKRRES